MTRYYHFVNGMEMAVLAEVTNQLHAAGYASTLDLVYSVAKQALDRLPPLYFSIKPLNLSPTTCALAGQSLNENNTLGAAHTSLAAGDFQPAGVSQSVPKRSQSIRDRLTAIPIHRKTSGQPSQTSLNRALTQDQKKQMKTAVRQAIQAMMKRQHREQLPHERWYSPSTWSEVGSGLPTNCYYG